MSARLDPAQKATWLNLHAEALVDLPETGVSIHLCEPTDPIAAADGGVNGYRIYIKTERSEYSQTGAGSTSLAT